MHIPGLESEPGARELIPMVYDELRRIAHAQFRRLPSDFTLRPTEAVNEACARLLARDHEDWLGKEHFRAVATRKIWQIALDHLRRRRCAKRGGPDRDIRDGTASGGPRVRGACRRVPLESIDLPCQEQPVDLLDVAEAVEALGADHPRLAEIVQLRWFGGLTAAEVARELGIGTCTVEKDLRFAIAWLTRRLSGAR